MRVDLNSDLGESFGPWPMGNDEAMLKFVTSANIAAGFHAGDPEVIVKACRLALRNKVSIGAHPGFLDLQGFGRRPIHGLSVYEIESFVAYQIGAVQALAKLAGGEVTHVKIHGAMSNMACVDDAMAEAIARAIRAVDSSLIFVVLPFSALQRAGELYDLRMAVELFADRAYADDGLLMSRKEVGAVIDDTEVAIKNVLNMVRNQAITTISGKIMPTRVDTICIHSDTPGAVTMALQLRGALGEAKVMIAPFSTWV